MCFSICRFCVHARLYDQFTAGFSQPYYRADHACHGSCDPTRLIGACQESYDPRRPRGPARLIRGHTTRVGNHTTWVGSNGAWGCYHEPCGSAPCVQGGSLSTHRHHSLTCVSNVLGIASPHKDLPGILRSSKDIS